MTTPPVPVIMDVDTGVDDALALLLAIRCPAVKVLAVTCVNGNMRVEQVVQNTLRVLDAAQARPDLPVAQGFTQPLIEEQHPPVSFVHGEDGLGGLDPPLPTSSREPVRQHAVQLLVETLEASEEPVTVVALGPLTNVAVAFRTAPELFRRRCARLVWMGGAVASGGNKTAWSEFNAGADPEAAHIVFQSGLPLLVYPWDVFLKPQVSKADLEDLGIFDSGTGSLESGARPWSALAGRLLSHLMRVFRQDAATLGDAGALVAFLLPEAATLRKLRVDVELQGNRTRGMTVCDLRPPDMGPESGCSDTNAHVVMDLDAAAIVRFYRDHVLERC